MHILYELRIQLVVQLRADYHTPNPHGEHLSSIRGAERLLPFWRELWEVRGMPTMLTVAVAPVALFRKCLRGEPTILDFRSFFVCLYVLHHGALLDFVCLARWFDCQFIVLLMFLAQRSSSGRFGRLHQLHIAVVFFVHVVAGEWRVLVITNCDMQFIVLDMFLARRMQSGWCGSLHLHI
jgi:hypothetical protein